MSAADRKWKGRVETVEKGDRFLSIEDMRRVARARGGACLSPHYRYAPAKLQWRCAKGHVWWAIGAKVAGRGRQKTWCLQCAFAAKLRVSVPQMRRLARERGGECLTEEVMSSVDRRWRWRCAAGHEWNAAARNIKDGHWCRRCWKPKPTFSIEDMRRVARERGGECLSAEYRGPRTKLRWRCREGHTWLAVPQNVRNLGNWCPVCAGTLPLDLDALARSYGGRCVAVGPGETAEWECAREHRWKSRPKVVAGGAWCPTCGLEARRPGLDTLRRVAKMLGGECLSVTEVRGRPRSTWRCAEGHEWSCFSPTVLVAGKWCGRCKGRRARKRLLSSIARFHGALIGGEYIDMDTPLAWLCREGHEFRLAPRAAVKRRWCPECPMEPPPGSRVVDAHVAYAMPVAGTGSVRGFLKSEGIRQRLPFTTRSLPKPHRATLERDPSASGVARWRRRVKGTRFAVLLAPVSPGRWKVIHIDLP